VSGTCGSWALWSTLADSYCPFTGMMETCKWVVYLEMRECKRENEAYL
jgi:hypothetical protein